MKLVAYLLIAVGTTVFALGAIACWNIAVYWFVWDPDEPGRSTDATRLAVVRSFVGVILPLAGVGSVAGGITLLRRQPRADRIPPRT